MGASVRDIRPKASFTVVGEPAAPAPYPAGVLADYRRPPETVPVCFPALLGCSVPPETPKRPFTLQSPLRDFRATFMGRILYMGVMASVRGDYRRARRMPPSLERDARLKNAYFLIHLMPTLTVRAMAMSSDGRFGCRQAEGFVELGNRRIIRGVRRMLSKE